jgi:hypothetical protein
MPRVIVGFYVKAPVCSLYVKGSGLGFSLLQDSRNSNNKYTLSQAALFPGPGEVCGRA